jgi:hypothetical protein
MGGSSGDVVGIAQAHGSAPATSRSGRSPVVLHPSASHGLP